MVDESVEGIPLLHFGIAILAFVLVESVSQKATYVLAPDVGVNVTVYVVLVPVINVSSPEPDTRVVRLFKLLNVISASTSPGKPVGTIVKVPEAKAVMQSESNVTIATAKIAGVFLNFFDIVITPICCG